MIVDLVRNDLSVVCTPESILVSDLLKVKSYSTVHQLVSDVSGKLRQDVRTSQAIAALFPGGSMTGAPKAKANPAPISALTTPFMPSTKYPAREPKEAIKPVKRAVCPKTFLNS
jgi:hypothetical protein